MNETFNISSSPHIRAKVTTGNIMFLVLIALMPTTLFGIYNFGVQALGIVFLTVASAVATEYLFERFMGKKITIADGSAAVTGLLLALNLPPTAPWWMCVLGAVFAILVVKQLFWRTWTEFYESGTCCEVLSFDFLYRENDNICL